MTTKLPPTLRRGRTVRVLNLNCLEASLDLGYGVSVVKNLVLEGVDTRGVPPARRSEAVHCLVLIAGGRDLIIHSADDTLRDGFIRARVFLDVVPQAPLPAGMCSPYGMDEVLVEVSMLYGWAATTGYDPSAVREAMKAVGRG